MPYTAAARDETAVEIELAVVVCEDEVVLGMAEDDDNTHTAVDDGEGHHHPEKPPKKVKKVKKESNKDKEEGTSKAAATTAARQRQPHRIADFWHPNDFQLNTYESYAHAGLFCFKDICNCIIEPGSIDHSCICARFPSNCVYCCILFGEPGQSGNACVYFGCSIMCIPFYAVCGTLFCTYHEYRNRCTNRPHRYRYEYFTDAKEEDRVETDGVDDCCFYYYWYGRPYQNDCCRDCESCSAYNCSCSAQCESCQRDCCCCCTCADLDKALDICAKCCPRNCRLDYCCYGDNCGNCPDCDCKLCSGCDCKGIDCPKFDCCDCPCSD